MKKSKIPFNLAFSGTGLLFPIHVGAYRALMEYDHFGRAHAVSGTSGGAIVAAAVSCGYSSDDMEDILKKFDLGAMLSFNMTALLRNGYSNGNKIKGALTHIFGKKRLRDTNIPLYIVCSDITKGEPFVFSSVDTPDVFIVDAIRSSVSIPIVLTPTYHNDSTLVDGMLFCGVPITIFEHNMYHTIGIAVSSHKDSAYSINGRFFGYLSRIFEMFLQGISRMHVEYDEVCDNVDLFIITAQEYHTLRTYPVSELVDFGYNNMVKQLAEL